VTAYRVYLVDGAGRLSRAEWIDAPDDDAATASAQAMMKAAPFELWQGNRLVVRIDARSVANPYSFRSSK
jgi:hypothetical protein